MEIIKETPCLRIRGQNSVDQEFLEIVGNGSSTGSVLMETIAVSVTISISVRILLRILSCSRVKEEHREHEVAEARVPVVECLDGLARITSKGLAPNSFCEKMASSRMLVLQDQEWLQIW